MHEVNSSFASLMRRLRAGDETAATEIFSAFVPRLIALARIHLDPQIRRLEDPDDVLQSVFRSFFLRYEAGQFDIQNADGLWALLALITLRKCGNRMEYYYAIKRDLKLDVKRIPTQPECEESASAWEPLAKDPTASQVAIFTETLEKLMAELDLREQATLALRLQGCTVKEISKELGWSEKTIRRSLEYIRRKLERVLN